MNGYYLSLQIPDYAHRKLMSVYTETMMQGKTHKHQSTRRIKRDKT
jgi:hypothetical protein